MNRRHNEGVTPIFGSPEMREPAPAEFIPKHKTPGEIAYQIVKDETSDQRGRRQTPRDDLAKVEEQLNHGVQKAARQTPVQSETDG